MRRRGHPGSENRFHVLCRILLVRSNRKRPDFGDAISVSRPPLFVFDGHQPHLAQGLDHCSSRALVCHCRSTSRIRVEMPEHWGLRKLAKGIVGHDPAADHLGSLAYRLANSTRNRNALRQALVRPKPQQKKRNDRQRTPVSAGVANQFLVAEMVRLQHRRWTTTQPRRRRVRERAWPEPARATPARQPQRKGRRALRGGRSGCSRPARP